ncbi:CPBP family intramembrane metalloprotease [Luteimonas sp. Y-2-2-4F]|nr:CPBP family intramembrane glutamic endopeptidase [Luteimonas sp. Y-2-2-4F]MCD9030162.1 CPBP family intramembrane metalloprotease [Luteimonas sp. Y-2-2-4F]
MSSTVRGGAIRRCLPALLVLASVVPLWHGYRMLAAALGAEPAGRLGAAAALGLAAIALVALALRLEGRDRRSLGMAARWREDLRAFAGGALLWTLPAAAGIALCLALGWARIEPLAGPGQAVRLLAWLVPAVLLSEAIPEELLFRGWLQSRLAARFARWLAVLLQAAAFCAFAWLAGAMTGAAQWMFLPGFALILGAVRALTGSLWTSAGVHAAWMGVAQALAPANGQFAVEGLATLQVVAFALLPSAAMGVWFGIRHAGFDWRARDPAAGA